MWLSVPIVATAFAVFTKLSIASASPGSFHFPDLKVLTDMFVDCDTIIVSDGGAPQNIQQVTQPFKLFNDSQLFRQLISYSHIYWNDYDSYKELMNYHASKIHFFRKELKGLSCRAQIMIFYQSSKLEKASSLYKISGFRRDESTYRYTVIAHRNGYFLDKKLYRWTIFDLSRIHDVPHFYHVTMSCQFEEKLKSVTETSNARVLSEIGSHYTHWRTCSLRGFKIACLNCKIDDVVEHPCKRSHPKECPLQIAQESPKDGSIKANERHLAIVHYTQFVVVHGLKFAFGSVEMSQKSRWANYRHFIKSIQTKFGGHAAVTKLDVLILPEEIFLHSVLTHHENMTVVSWEERNHNYINSGETIVGPGRVAHTSSGSVVETVPVGETGLTFMTCSNITFVPHTGIFFSPFDSATWIWALMTVIAVSVTMLMGIKGIKIFPALFLTLYTLMRLLLENHGGVSRALVSRQRLMASLTFLIALATIILSTGYKGVLTSDFAKPPKVGAAPTFEQVLASNWSIFRHTSLAFPKGQKGSLSFELEWTMRAKVDDSLDWWKLTIDVVREADDFVYTENGLKEYQLVSKVLEKLTQDTDKLKRIKVEEDMSSLLGECHCNGSYWVFETGTFRQPGFPKACQNGSHSLIFLLSEERIAKASVSWGHPDMRPGPLFKSIRRAIEAGLYKWLSKVRSSSIFGVYLKDHVMTRQLKKEPKPLSLKTLLVLSTMELYGVLSLLTVGVLIGEWLWARRKLIYFAVRGWTKVQWQKMKKRIIKCYEKCKRGA